MAPPPVVLCILDGVGWGRRDDTDAVAQANTPTLTRMMATAPWCLLTAHGKAVGLPSDADMGNSEVGHNAMGAGRVFDQGAKLVEAAIASGRIWQTEAWKTAVARGLAGGTLHLLGLLSDGNVHSHVRHLHAILERARVEGLRRVRVHILTDGRDVQARSALTWIEPLERILAEMPGDCAIASGGGRMRITMDRYGAEWAMVARGWRTHVHGQGRHFASASDAVKTLYAEDPKIDDQHLPAFIVGDYAGMKDGDAIILTNFRGDRAVEITEAFEGRPGFAAFDRGVVPQVSFAGMMRYDGDLALPSSFLVQPPEIADTVGERLAAAGLRVFATSETQKFGHVTYFFNGNRSAPLAGEVWKELPSFAGGADAHPEMRAAEIAAAVVQALDAGGYHHIRFNLANGDMVGHTGDFAATVRAVEAADAALAQVWAACAHHGALLLVTADHGNADEMFKLDKAGRPLIAADGQPMPSSSHSLNPVPFILLDPTGRWTLKQGGGQSGGGLAQIGATLLELCGLQAPASYLPSLVTPTGAQP